MSEDREARAAATRSRRAWLQPRWFVVLFWHGHRALLRVTRGRLGLWRPKPGGWGALRLTTTGRRTGRPRQVVVGYFEDGRNLITMAMNGWGVAEPAWWLNLQAHPDATAQTRDGARQVRARRAQGDERERLWSRWAEIDKNLDAYAARRPTETAVVVLEPQALPAQQPDPCPPSAPRLRQKRARDEITRRPGHDRRAVVHRSNGHQSDSHCVAGLSPQGPDFLATVALHQNRLLAAALFQLLAAFTSAAIAVTLYPVLRQYAAGMALGSVAFRLIEGVFYALSAVGTLILVSLSGQLTAGASAHASADLVRDLRDSASCVGVLASTPAPRSTTSSSTGHS